MQDTKLLNRAIRVGRPTNTDQYQEMIDSTIEKSKNQDWLLFPALTLVPKPYFLSLGMSLYSPGHLATE